MMLEPLAAGLNSVARLPSVPLSTGWAFTRSASPAPPSLAASLLVAASTDDIAIASPRSVEVEDSPKYLLALAMTFGVIVLSRDSVRPMVVTLRPSASNGERATIADRLPADDPNIARVVRRLGLGVGHWEASP